MDELRDREISMHTTYDGPWMIEMYLTHVPGAEGMGLKPILTGDQHVLLGEYQLLDALVTGVLALSEAA